VQQFRSLGWSELDAVLRKSEGEWTQFQEQAMRSITLYSRAITKFDQSERLIYTFTALEGMLLRDQSESIAQNIADRMAFALEKGMEERLAVVAAVRAAYEVRSKFIHHLQHGSDANEVSQFLIHAWMFFVRVLTAWLPHAQTKSEFIGEIEAVKYS